MDGYAGKGHQVLLIDDDSEFCELMTDYLDVHSFAVSSVHTGTAGIEAARRQEYDVILLDMLLPDISGIEVLRHLRTETRAPVVILSAHNEETDRIVTLELGADDYVPKTFSARDLTSMEFQLLYHLARGAGRIFSREDLLNLFAEKEWNKFDRCVDVHISSLRKKLGDNSRCPTYLKTVRGLGYMFIKQSDAWP